jgi:hypothetical protein
MCELTLTKRMLHHKKPDRFLRPVGFVYFLAKLVVILNRLVQTIRALWKAYL